MRQFVERRFGFLQVKILLARVRDFTSAALRLPFRPLPLAISGVYTPVLAKCSQNFRFEDSVVGDYSRRVLRKSADLLVRLRTQGLTRSQPPSEEG